MVALKPTTVTTQCQPTPNPEQIRVFIPENRKFVFLTQFLGDFSWLGLLVLDRDFRRFQF